MARRPLLSDPHQTASGAVIGRPRKGPPEDAAERIKAFAAEGFSLRGVGYGLGVNPEVLARWFDEQPALKDAYDRGREQERHTLHNVLFRAATEGAGKDSLIAAMFLLKARHGYREGDQGEQANRVNITFNLPGALKPAEFIEAIEHERND